MTPSEPPPAGSDELDWEESGRDEFDSEGPDAAPDDEEHFVPPEPPPLPRPQPATVGAGLLFVLGIVLVAAPSLVGLTAQYGLPLGLLSITAAIAWLVARLGPGPPPDTDPGDGAQV